MLTKVYKTSVVLAGMNWLIRGASLLNPLESSNAYSTSLPHVKTEFISQFREDSRGNLGNVSRNRQNIDNTRIMDPANWSSFSCPLESSLGVVR
jgi:hypothetical protein